MAIFKLQTNLPKGTTAPEFINKDDFNSIPKKPGVYVYGIKILINKIEKFIPLYVGIRNDIQSRLMYHHKENGLSGNSKKELFDLSQISSILDVNGIYGDMQLYDSKKGLDPLRLGIQSLIWFNNSTFFDAKCNLPKSTSTYISNSGHQASIKVGGDLDIMGTPQSILLKNKVIDLKKLYSDKFFCAYCTLDSIVSEILKDKKHPLHHTADCYNKCKDYTIIGGKNGSGKTICEYFENTLKSRLSTIGIHTSAKSTSKILAPTDQFDLSIIQNDLVNLGNHNYGNPFNIPLII